MSQETHALSASWRVRAAVIMLLDAVVIAASYMLALLLRFDFAFGKIPPVFFTGYQTLILPITVIAIVTMWAFRLYHSIWRFASFNELIHSAYAWAVISVITPTVSMLLGVRMPISFWTMGDVLAFGFTTVIRFSWRLLRRVSETRTKKGSRHVMVVGAGEAGCILIREMVGSDRLNMDVCCAIDDNINKTGRYIEGIPIVGGHSMIVQAAKKYHIDLIVFAIPSLVGPQRKAILKECQAAGCEVQVIPGMYQLVDGQVSVSKLRSVKLEDLLGRDPIVVNAEEVRSFVEDRVVLVTGGGGSIGSELCRQVAKDDPKKLIIFDVYENNAYAIQQELKHDFPNLDLETLIGSVRNESRIRWVFKHYRPQVVFHAAAHKHVPLMEDSPNEAVKNNVMGTFKCAQAALDYGAKRFVLISTDKAVNPTNVMGATKRLCEMVVQMMDRKADALGKDTDFVAVRFGNVLGSNGSVVPLFEKQIAEGGPVTVTDKRITRYFMTIPEAVSLVLQAACYAKGGEIFVLDMGEPVRIDDMARNLIQLSGYVPDVDIPIVYTGLRPGEKLYEERLMDEEGLRRTSNKLISIAEPIPMDDAQFRVQLGRLDEASRAESAEIRHIVAEVVLTYHPSEN